MKKTLSNIKKIILTGDGGVGRTTLLHRFVEGEFDPNTKMTIGFNFNSKSIEIEEREIKMVFFDLAGQSRFRYIQKSYIGGCDGAILAFDLTRPLTLENIEEWVSFLRFSNPNLPILLVGLKADLFNNIEIDDDYLLQKIDSLNLLGYIKASCKTGFNVDLIFEVLARNILGLTEVPQPYPDPLTDVQMIRQNRVLNGYSDSQVINLNQIEITQFKVNRFIQTIQEELINLYNKGINSEKHNFDALIEKIIQNSLEKSDFDSNFFKLVFIKEFNTIKNHISSFLTLEDQFGNKIHDVINYINYVLNPLINTFVINEKLCLKYENGVTNIYVNNRRFYQCKYLLLNLDCNNIEKYDNINSIDEAADTLDHSLELTSQNPQIIDSRTEFWGHCSNLQAWYENKYDTRILHRNLAFPLLKKLADAGDRRAIRSFKEEIGRRFETGYPSVVLYLLEEGFLHYLNKTELDALEISSIEYKNLIFWEKLANLYFSHGLSENIKIAIDKIRKINPNYKLSNKKLSHFK